MKPVEQKSVDVAALNGDFRGTVVGPGEQGWDEGRAAWNLVADQHPAAEFVALGIGLPMSPEMGEAIKSHLDKLRQTLEPWSTGGLYFNFAGRPADLEELFASDTLGRLREVKQRYDPDGLIRANHAIA